MIISISFLILYSKGLLLILCMMSLLWLVSVLMKNAGIADIFWGIGFAVVNLFYYLASGASGTRSNILLILVTVWGFRLAGHLAIRNLGKPEDFRYQKFRHQYGEKRYWWVSFFQVFLLQGLLMWLISAPFTGTHLNRQQAELNVFDLLAFLLWVIGFAFEAGGDRQLASFRARPANRGKLLDTGFWRYTRHPNYFGDAAVWWAFGLFSVAAGNVLPLLSSLLMTILLVRISGVALLEKTLRDNKPGYREYMEKTSPFIPWFPKKPKQ